MPSIGIIGTQNVGKSTLFNALIRRNKSITYDKPGVTVDLVTERVDWGEGRWEVTDFPGLEADKNLGDDHLGRAAIERAIERIEEYNLLLWVVSRKGLSAYENDLANHLRKMKRPVWLVVNHVDDPSLEAEATEYYSLGFEKVFFVSALNRRNLGELKDTVIEHFGGALPSGDEPTEAAAEEESLEPAEKTEYTLAIVGKPNAGKSTLFNTLVKKESALVSDTPGTTRDTLDEVFTHNDKTIRLFDTAGLRRRRNVRESVEVFSVARTRKAITGADMIIHLVNATEGFDRQNKAVIEDIAAANKPAVIVVNKIDLIDTEERENVEADVEEIRRLFWKFPVYYIVAKESKKVVKILEKALSLYDETSQKIPTPRLNRILDELNENPILHSHSVRFNYITQAWPERRFILFGNTGRPGENIIRYIKSSLCKKLGWTEIPVAIDFRKKPGKEADWTGRRPGK